jgi:hypothetical protein
MASIAPGSIVSATDGDILTPLVAAEGTAGHLYAASLELLSGRFATRNLADTVHYLSTMHGRHPGVVDHAAIRTAHDAARKWLIDAVDGFSAERLYLTKLVVAAGPIPSTPGQAECEAAVVGQRHALEMLAQSDRDGCAIGAAIALVMDWHAVRGLLNVAADRLGVERFDCTLPSQDECHALVVALSASPSVQRAMNFGAQQLIGQHRGLWDLLEARQLARGEY